MSWFKDHFSLTSPQPEQPSTEWFGGRVTGAPGTKPEPPEDFNGDARAQTSTPKGGRS